jgi:hypothetical protein
MRKLLILGLLLLLLAPVMATQTKDFSTSNEFYGLMVDTPKQEVFKLDQNITLNVHVFNALTGVPLSNLTNTTYNLSCVAHFYNTTGDKIAEDILVYDGDYDFYDTITDPAITGVLGRHTYRVWCGVWDPNAQPPDLMVGGWVSAFFDITTNGQPIPDSAINILMMLAFLAILAGLIWSLIKIAKDLATMETAWSDLALSYIFYFTAFVLFIFSKTYFNDLMVNNMLGWMIDIGAFTNVVIPTIAAIFTWWMNIITMKKIGNMGGPD